MKSKRLILRVKKDTSGKESGHFEVFMHICNRRLYKLKKKYLYKGTKNINCLRIKEIRSETCILESKQCMLLI